MESPASTQSAVTRCGRFVSYAAITLERLTCLFPSAAGQSVPLGSIGLSSASVRLPRCHSRSTRTCSAMPVGSSSPTMATTRGVLQHHPRAQKHSTHVQVAPIANMVEGCDTIIIVADSPSVKQIQSKTAFISHIHCGMTRIDQMCYGPWRDTQCIAPMYSTV